MHPKLILRKGRDKAVWNRHPWLFSGAVARVEGEPQDGAVVEIVAADGETLGWGHYAPDSQIRARLFAWPPQAPPFGDAFWQARFTAARDLRAVLLDGERTDGFRLLNAEGDGTPAVIVDAYADTAVLQLRSAGAEALAPVLAGWLQEQGYARGLLKPERRDGAEPVLLWGETAEEAAFRENDFVFYADLAQGQKTGFFLDQRESRAWVGDHVRDFRVLNAFSYTGAFSVYALAGGARSVQDVDVSKRALTWAERHVRDNLGDAAPYAALAADCFDYLRALEPGLFDAIVLDPPAFSKNVNTVPQAARGYKDVNLLAMRALPPEGGLLCTFSCSQHVDAGLFRKIIFAAAADAQRSVRALHVFGHAPDHPFSVFHPEGEYLKGLALWVE